MLFHPAIMTSIARAIGVAALGVACIASATAQNFGTPASATDVYATTKEMKEEKLVYRELTPTNGRQARRDGIAVEDLTQIWLEKEGEKQLIETFLFYDQAYAYLRAHPDLMMTRLLLSAVRREE